MQIKELSQKTGVSERCLRYYETVGLLTAARQGNGYRQYEASAIAEVEKIRFYLALGLSTQRILAIINCSDPAESERPLCREAYDLYKQRLAEIEEQIGFLQGIAQKLQKKMAAFDQING